MSKRQEGGTTILESRDQELIDRVANHIGEEFLNWTEALVAGYIDGGLYGGSPDPRSRAAMAATGEFFASGGSGPKKKK